MGCHRFYPAVEHRRESARSAGSGYLIEWRRKRIEPSFVPCRLIFMLFSVIAILLTALTKSSLSPFSSSSVTKSVWTHQGQKPWLPCREADRNRYQFQVRVRHGTSKWKSSQRSVLGAHTYVFHIRRYHQPTMISHAPLSPQPSTPLVIWHPEAMRRMALHYESTGREFNEA